MSVTFEDNSIKAKEEIRNVCLNWLEEIASDIESQAKRNTPVKTGHLKSSWKHIVDEDKLEATIGNPLEYAIWQEFGTGQYAVEGNGRKTPWLFTDENGKNHESNGIKPKRMLFKAFNSVKGYAQKRLEDMLKGL